MKQKSFVEELKGRREAKAEAPSRRFMWKENVIAPAKPKRMDFQGSAGEAPIPHASGKLSPVDLPEERAKIADAKRAKKERY